MALSGAEVPLDVPEELLPPPPPPQPGVMLPMINVVMNASHLSCLFIIPKGSVTIFPIRAWASRFASDDHQD